MSTNPSNPQYGNNNNSYSMSPMGAPTGGIDFFSRISAIQDRIRALNGQVSQIRDLQTRSLSSTNENETAKIDSDLTGLNEDVRSAIQQLKNDLQSLVSSGSSSAAQTNQIQRLTENLRSAAQEYQTVEMKYRQDVQDRLRRQFKIVQPNATPEQVNEAVSNTNNPQIFQQALLNSDKYGQARTAYQDVQDRHQDLRKIEDTLTELAQLFMDLDLLVVQQGEVVNTIQKNAADVEFDTSKANKELDSAKVHAQRARKMKIILFWVIVVVVIIIIAAVVGSICGNGSC